MRFFYLLFVLILYATNVFADSSQNISGDGSFQGGAQQVGQTASQTGMPVFETYPQQMAEIQNAYDTKQITYYEYLSLKYQIQWQGQQMLNHFQDNMMKQQEIMNR